MKTWVGFTLVLLTTCLLINPLVFADPTRSIGKKATKASQKSDNKKNGVLRLLIWEGHAPQAHIERFKRLVKEKYDYKIRLQISYMTGADDYFDLVRSRSVDLVMLTHDLFKDERFDFIKKRLLIPLNLSNIPNYKHVVSALKEADYLRNGDEIYGAPESQGPYALAFNTSRLKIAPNTWNILWDPRFKRKYVIGANEYIYNTHVTALALGYPRESLGKFDELNNSAFKKKLRQLVVNANGFWIGVDKAENLINHSLATVWGDSLVPLEQRGEVWKIAEPVEGTPFWIDNCALTSALKGKPLLKRIAEEYINGLLSTEYQVNHIMRVIKTIPIVSNIDHLLTDEEKSRPHVGNDDFTKKNRIVLPTVSARDRNGLKLLWKEAMKGIQAK